MADDAQTRATEAIAWRSSDKNADLLPLPTLSGAEFENFTEAVLKAQRFLGPDVRHVAHVERWGVPGDKQDGIDFAGHFNDGAEAAWQCKQIGRLRPFEVREIVEAVTYDGAEGLYLVYSRAATKLAREELRKHASWRLLDRRDLTDMVRELPAFIQRDILERFWGPGLRRGFVEAAEDGFISIETFRQRRLNPHAVMNDRGVLAGRATELESLAEALADSAASTAQIVVVNGPGGRGKTRLAVEALFAHRAIDPTIPIACLTPQRSLSAIALRELRPQRSIVFVDDAHLDPTSLAPLLDWARRTPEVRVMIATRSSALSAVNEQITLAQFSTRERTTVEVPELETGEARALVKGLIDGLDLTFAFRNYLAEQAVDSPHVVVIATNLIRNGELTGDPRVNQNLRQIVLDRYRELLVSNDVDGFTSATIQRVVATYALLAPVRSDDESLKVRIADFCHLQIFELARLVRTLTDRGVLVEGTDGIRVVPDVLADRICEITAAVENYPTGYVRDLWSNFGHDHHNRLARSLGELDWRLTRAGTPSVMSPVWDAIRDRLRSPSPARLCDELDRMTELAATQPAQVVDALEEVRARLRDEDADSTPVGDDDQTDRQAMGLRELERDDVRRRMPKLYTRAAANDPDLLERALDALWGLRRRDPSPTNSNPDHAARKVADELANLTRLPDASFPQRIVASAARWVADPDRPVGDTSPLFVLRPLLVKEQLETRQSRFMQLEFHPHLISADYMRRTRDEIRDLLLQTGGSSELALAGAAVELLSVALKPPHGYFGQKVSDDAVLQWEADDLQTVETLDRISSMTKSAVVRRRVRDEITWAADHAKSVEVQHSALMTASRLDADNTLEALLARKLLHGGYDRSADPVRRVPTVEELLADRERERVRMKDITDEQRMADRDGTIHNLVATRHERAQARDAELVRHLLALDTPAQMVAALDHTARDAQQIIPNRHITLWGVWKQLETQAPDLLGALVREISALEPGPLDAEEDNLIAQWMTVDPKATSAWIKDALTDGRLEIRVAVGRAFERFVLETTDGPLDEIWSQGVTDADDAVVQTFLSAAGGMLRTDPAHGVTRLLDNDVSAPSATRALESACRYDGQAYGSDLDVKGAPSILRLIDRASLESHAVQEMVAGIASSYPELALDFLAGQVRRPDEWHHLHDDIYGLPAAFEALPEALWKWMLTHMGKDRRVVTEVVRRASGGRLKPTLVSVITTECAQLDAQNLETLVEVLNGLRLWAVEHPELASTILKHARTFAIAESTLAEISYGGMRLGTYSWMNGVSEELDLAIARCARAIEATEDPDLKRAYKVAHDNLRDRNREVADRHARDLEEDW